MACMLPFIETAMKNGILKVFIPRHIAMAHMLPFIETALKMTLHLVYIPKIPATL